MPVASESFNKYQIVYYSSPTLDTALDCLINCYADSTWVGRIEFYKEAADEASLKSEIKGGQPYVRYRLSRFGDVMQILLHEKPLYLIVHGDTDFGSLATTNKEPIGEEEP